MADLPNIESLELPESARVCVVYKRSLYDLYVLEHEDEHIKQLLEDDNAAVANLQVAHERHEAGLASVIGVLEASSCSLNTIYRGDVTGLITAETADLVVVVGGDGTLLDASHYVVGIPVIGVNSDPISSVGALHSTVAARMGAFWAAVEAGESYISERTRLQASLNGVQIGPPILNDVLLAHSSPASTTKYIIEHGGQSETQGSSGIWISTASGSTAAIASAGGSHQDPHDPRLQYKVRELYRRPNQEYHLTEGFVEPGHSLVVTSKIRRGSLYLDGPHIVEPIAFGDVLTFTQSDAPLRQIQVKEV